MKRNLLIAMMGLVLFSQMALADVPMKINYQGRATDASGIPVADGTYGVIFRIYNVESSGSPIWSESQTVATKQGYFNTALGSNLALTPACFTGPAWLEVMWSGDGAPMAPRHQLNSVPYAIAAASANTASALVDNAIKTSMIGNSQVTGAKIASGTIAGGNIAANTITGGTSGNIGATTITSANIANGAIDTQAKAPKAPIINGGINYPKIVIGGQNADVSGNTTIDISAYNFSNAPMVFCTPVSSTDGWFISVHSVTVSQFKVQVRYSNNTLSAVWFNWVAIGN